VRSRLPPWRPLIALLLTALATPARADPPCPDRAAQLDLLEQSVVGADFAAVPQRIDDVIYAMGCGPVATAEELADLWNGEGAYLALAGETEAAVDSFQAAKRVAPDGWNEVYGSALKKAWEAAPAPATSGEIDVDPRPHWWSVYLDGELVDDLPVAAPTGLHVVQIGPGPDDIRAAKLLYLRPDAVAVAAHEQEEGPRPAPQPAPVDPGQAEVDAELVEAGPPLSTSVAAGGAVALGRSEGVSSAAQLATPVETGAIARFGSSWARLCVAASLRLGSRWVFEDGQAASSTPAGLGMHGAGGAHTAQGDVGVLLGYQWPGRVPVRILYAAPLGDGHLQLEGRLGMNVGRGAEPAAEVLLAFRPPLLWPEAEGR